MRLQARGIGLGVHFRAVHLHPYYLRGPSARRRSRRCRSLVVRGAVLAGPAAREPVSGVARAAEGELRAIRVHDGIPTAGATRSGTAGCGGLSGGTGRACAHRGHWAYGFLRREGWPCRLRRPVVLSTASLGPIGCARLAAAWIARRPGQQGRPRSLLRSVVLAAPGQQRDLLGRLGPLRPDVRRRWRGCSANSVPRLRATWTWRWSPCRRVFAQVVRLRRLPGRDAGRSIRSS